MMIEREPYEYNGRTYNNYFIKGVIDGDEVRVKLTPPDNGGYKVLDIIFKDDRAVELALKPYQIKDGTGRIVKGNTYSARSVGANGEVLECKLKPARDSDKSLLEMLLSQ
jgi:hypothetical protein